MNPNFQMPQTKSKTDLALAYLTLNAKEFGLGEGLDNLKLDKVQSSLLGDHFRFQQYLHGIKVEGAEIIVSISKEDGTIYRVYNNTYPVTEQHKRPAITLEESEAFEMAWQALKVHGPLLAEPKSEKLYLPEGKSFRLVYKTLLAVEAPYGYWEQRVDAVTGKIVDLREERITRHDHKIDLGDYDGPVDDRAMAFAAYREKAAMQNQPAKTAKRAAGTGMVFDPDPRTTLNDESLRDNSDPSAFTAAYFQRDLLDITEDSGTFTLVGPWATILDFEAPSTAPSSTTDGNWTATRGDNAFNDAMTYFHIDQNQRYIQSLGFSGDNGIQEVSIGIDTDGWNGDDNSSYSPGTNRMSFGHGCVDDNEDADVILHEYGHAIHHSINSNWSGGDTGGMGEGFGDYWAGSYSYATPNGPTFNPNWAFSWDGHHDCWDGRIMNDFEAEYNHDLTYPAHRTVGGTYSDQLWSTPLFQAFLTLVEQHSIPREQVDTIILESHFGISAGPKMRDMANATIQTARRLYPDGPHSNAFFQAFLRHNIIEVAHAEFVTATWEITSDLGVNNVPDPGETVTFEVTLENAGTADATAISAVLTSSTGNIQIPAGQSAYPDIAMGNRGANTTAFQVAIDDLFECGGLVELQLAVTFDDGTEGDPVTVNFNHSFRTGVPQGFTQGAEPAVAIPDNDSAGITSTIDVSGATGTVTAEFNVDLSINHTYQGDLRVTLTSPEGTAVVLHNRTGGTAEDIIGNYPGNLDPAEALSGFIGEDPNGTWTLTVSDNANLDTGTLNSWAINDVSGYDCSNPNCSSTATATAANNGVVCAGFPIQLSVEFTGVGDQPAITWSNPELLDDANSATPTAYLMETTTFQVTLRGEGCDAQAEVTVTVNAGLDGYLPYWANIDGYHEEVDLDDDQLHTVLDMIMLGNTCNNPE